MEKQAVENEKKDLLPLYYIRLKSTFEHLSKRSVKDEEKRTIGNLSRHF